ncbi:Replication factor C (RF-C) subunit [Yamadazyma tenuis]|uniref:AAA+ ATPase domain-containing protein n=1 Tax=Candida tenuis (strain ATCC 10573 / BCRC 21748 / CBS 615 / JCM 9827 / NBRC 10315 / NRRL Y-1498 / VKM Y-70) TaxID=590646 RepID=G3BC31_CANTC|nr:uncharacterized protein CANTEDRAFT_111192 [Yamadazyma tenuis ATCC 10573]EGV60768.1 hypothetical protein CANTEDRAFT_111192 [Yamadazyma tenuis ATCC 10573]WEJ93958.1 Replication factor C (RF-C) subunit [Yamadazyma tenuis]
MSLWVDKYRPRRLDALSYHAPITASLKALASTGDFPHLLVYGPSGSGKKTRVYATLHELFGPQVEKLKIDVKTFTTSSNRKLEFNVLSSPFHLEITPSDMGNNDRVVIQDLLKDIASTEQVDFSNSKNNGTPKHRFKVVIINEADSLTRDAQAALRRTMEKYSANIRLIMISNTTSNIIPPIKSRTLLVRIPAPSVADITAILADVATKESVHFTADPVQSGFLSQVAANSDQNLRRALLSFETISMSNASVACDGQNAVVTLDWEVIIKNVSSSIYTNRSVSNLAKTRVVFYELLAHCIPARIILKGVLFELLRLCNNHSKAQQLVEIGSMFDERLSLGSKAIFHLEGFVAKAMVALE